MTSGRHPGQLIAFLVGVGVVAFALWRMQTGMPAMAGIIMPFYWIIGMVAAVVTWRWFRARTEKDRRGTDRRQEARRDDP